MASQHNSGSQAATVTTEHFLGTDPDTTTGVFQFMVDVSVLARGDSLEIRVYEKINDTGDTAQVIHTYPINNEQDADLFVSEAFILVIGFRFSIKQTTGTGRTFQWSVRKA
jgi:hypothetical protein